MSNKRKIVESASKKFTALPDNQKYYVLGFIHREELDALTKKEKRLLGLQSKNGQDELLPNVSGNTLDAEMKNP